MCTRKSKKRFHQVTNFSTNIILFWQWTGVIRPLYLFCTVYHSQPVKLKVMLHGTIFNTTLLHEKLASCDRVLHEVKCKKVRVTLSWVFEHHSRYRQRKTIFLKKYIIYCVHISKKREIQYNLYSVSINTFFSNCIRK